MELVFHLEGRLFCQYLFSIFELLQMFLFLLGHRRPSHQQPNVIFWRIWLTMIKRRIHQSKIFKPLCNKRGSCDQIFLDLQYPVCKKSFLKMSFKWLIFGDFSFFWIFFLLLSKKQTQSCSLIMVSGSQFKTLRAKSTPICFFQVKRQKWNSIDENLQF